MEYSNVKIGGNTKHGLKILRNNEIPRDKWKTLLSGNKYASAFQSPEFYDLFNSVPGHAANAFAVVNDAGISALCVVTIYEDKGIKGYFSRRAIIYGGIVSNSSNNEILEYLLCSVISELKNKAIYIEVRNISDVSVLNSAFINCGFKYIDHLDIIFDLSKSEEKLWEEVHKNRKKEIKKGLNKGLNVRLVFLENNDLLSRIYKMLKQLYSKIGLPLPTFEFFCSAVKYLEPNNIMRTFCAFVGEDLVGFRIVLTYNNMIYDWYAASDEEYLSYRPNDILPWEILKWGIRNSFDSFDFGGAGKPGISYGVRDYKMKFGGLLCNHGRYLRVNKPIMFMIGKAGMILLKKKK